MDNPEALELLNGMPFEGNIRELRNLLERASLLADGEEIEPRHLLDNDSETAASRPATPSAMEWLTLEENECRYLAWALAHHKGDRATLARRLGISERTLFRKIKACQSLTS